MSLNWDLTKIENMDELCWVEDPEHPGVEEEKVMNPVTNSLIWACLSIGMTGITEKNWQEFYVRVHLIELLSGTFLMEPGNPKKRYWITPEDVKQHINLRTNVANQTWNQMCKEQCGNFRSTQLRLLTQAGEDKEQNERPGREARNQVSQQMA